MPQQQAKDAYFPFWFPLSRKAWERYRLTDLASEEPNAVPGGLVFAMRAIADRLNAKRDSHTYAANPIHAGQLMAFAILSDIFRYMTDRYCIEQHAGIMLEALEAARATRGDSGVERPLCAFAELYPATEVRKGLQAPPDFLKATEHRYSVARETLLLYLAMENPALDPFLDFFDDSELKRTAPYEPLVAEIERFFASRPEIAGGQTLFELLRAPARACPNSIEGQLAFIRHDWADFLPAGMLEWLLVAEGVMKEAVFTRGHGPGPAAVLQFGREYSSELSYPEPEAFTNDKDWMSNVVLIAKTVYVWLDQLSKKHQRAITRLDEIPDEELARLGRWGFTGLWLIGVWERSPASQRIKQITGNPEAVASAYSLYDYVIAADLGGDEAYRNLRDRAWRYGIRLASDMVPNHVGLYSRWVIEHPDWFLQLDYPAFPCYQFTGTDLSQDERVGLFIEDGYWDNRDASVVFKRVDRFTGSVRYIYHGNDGTNMPWNDTAQLNFLIPEVREAVIQTILHVARQFPIIRFDAAMTLAKRHYQRLWFPKPGEAGAIPSRAEHGMSKEEFDQVFPKEFWREVVDRIQSELPDTLLLAEAFWLMEGYFVRTLGMHRVYNSAFMNMLKMEENANYRQTVKNILEFSPEVIKRLVNFMNNPDERTAVAQFGKDDKYYGVAVLMVTMPGLPMFGHGQIEGFTEKYGMEYRRAYWDEQVDEHMVARHEAEIFPLMRKRHLFSGADHFALFDAYTPEGWVDENVFAYSNRAGDERALILYNNAYNTTRGTIHTSTAINIGDTENKNLIQRSIAEALALDTSDNCYYVFRDHRTRLERMIHAPRVAREGFSFELHGYEYNAFLDWREIHDQDGSWTRLCESLGGRPVASIDEAHRAMRIEPVLNAFRGALNADMLSALARECDDETRGRFGAAMTGFLNAVASYARARIDAAEIVTQCVLDIQASLSLVEIIEQVCPQNSPFASQIEETERVVSVAMVSAIAGHVSRIGAIDPDTHEALLTEPTMIGIASEAFRGLGLDEAAAQAASLLALVLAAHDSPLEVELEDRLAALEALFDDVRVKQYLLMNRHEGILWLNKERIEQLLFAFLFKTRAISEEAVTEACAAAHAILAVVDAAGYQVDKIAAAPPQGVAEENEDRTAD